MRSLASPRAATATRSMRSARLSQAATSGPPTSSERSRPSELYFTKSDGKVYIKKPDGTLLDAATGEPVTGEKPFGLKEVRVNNRVRGAIDAALGSLNLLAPDPARRRAAAEAVFKSRDADALPAVEAALAKETDPSIKAVLEQARAAIVIGDPDVAEADRVDAVVGHRRARRRGRHGDPAHAAPPTRPRR